MENYHGKRYLTALEAAAILGVSRCTVFRLRQRRRLKAAGYYGKKVYFLEDDILHLKENRFYLRPAANFR